MPLAILLISATAGPAALADPLQDCLCVCAIDPGRSFCGETQSCFYNPDPTCGSTPGCIDPAHGECINTIACSVPCNRTPFNHAFGAPGDNAATTALRTACRQDCDDRFGDHTPTAIGTPTRTATRSPTGTATATRQTATATATLPVEVDRIACGEQVAGALDPSDQDFFGDGTWADLYDLHLPVGGEVTARMDADAFVPYVAIFPADLENAIMADTLSVTVELPAGEYVIVANNFYQVEPGHLPYTLAVDCPAEATATSTVTATRTATATITRTREVELPTATHTATPPPTATRTPTATLGVCPVVVGTGEVGPAAGPGCVDLVADAIEVVQTVQNLEDDNTNVRLVLGKPTFVRFHVHSVQGNVRATARLTVGESIDDPLATVLLPINPGGSITLTEQPDRRLRDAAFLFELPRKYTGFVDGDSVYLEAEVRAAGVLPESNLSNNTRSTIKSFRYVPTFPVVLYHIGYKGVAAPSGPDEPFHADRILDWLERAYPVPGVDMWQRSSLWQPNVFTRRGELPTCDRVDRDLAWSKVWNSLFDRELPSYATYYGLVFDRRDPNNFVRGCTPLGEKTSTGPTGNASMYGNFAWDTDGSYGDWYAGHEIGHGLFQHHPGVCPGEDISNGAGPHHTNGRISELLQGPSAVYGFDAGTQAIYAPDVWTDVMSYCDHQWISDLTYHALMDRLRPQEAGSSAGLIVIGTDGLVVAGTIDRDAGTIDLDPLIVLPGAADVGASHDQGDFAIALRDGSGDELARYRFAPSPVEYGPPGTGTGEDVPRQLLFAEVVPYVDGTSRVDVEGPGVFATVGAGMADPEVRLLSPNGGETLAGDQFAVEWTASDADGDPLTFAVQYSADDGGSWELLAQNVTESRLDIDAFNVRPTDAGRFRVWASDGIHTASDTSDGTFTVPNTPPQVSIRAPANGTTVASGQTVALQARVFDRGTGVLPAEQLEWHSSLDGLLGHGRRLAVSDLSVGRHDVTFTADDGAGGVASDHVAIVVVSDLSALPPACAGDCNGDGSVAINELISGVAIALDTAGVDSCLSMDGDGDLRISISELVSAVRAALEGCGAPAIALP